MADMLTLVAYLKAKPGNEEETKQTLLSLVGPSRKEAGCIDYHLHQSDDDPGLFFFYENWRSKQDLDDHFEMPYLKEFMATIGNLLAEEIDIKFFTMLSDRNG